MSSHRDSTHPSSLSLIKIGYVVPGASSARSAICIPYCSSSARSNKARRTPCVGPVILRSIGLILYRLRNKATANNARREIAAEHRTELGDVDGLASCVGRGRQSAAGPGGGATDRTAAAQGLRATAAYRPARSG